MTLSLGNTDAVLITTTTNPVLAVSGSDQLLFLKVTACNIDTVAHPIYLWRVPAGGSPANAYLLVDGQSIPPGGGLTIIPIAGKSLVNSEQLFAKATQASLVNLSLDWATL